MAVFPYVVVVIDTDGSAFITKAEFDSLKNNFQAQIDNYNSSIDSKIDGAIASYLAGIKLSTLETKNLLVWPGKSLGLVEDPLSHPYRDGQVAGQIIIDLWASTSAQYNRGNASVDPPSTATAGYGYTCYCHHELENDGSEFKYLVADWGRCSGQPAWDILGYGDVNEKMVGSVNYRTSSDYTTSGACSIGVCGGWVSTYGTAGNELGSYPTSFGQLCEAASRPYQPYDALEGNRGTNFGAAHIKIDLRAERMTFTSDITYNETLRYITNEDGATRLVDVFPEKWYGTNMSEGHDTHTGKYDLYGMGWRMTETTDGSVVNNNFHVKTTASMNYLYSCGNQAKLRKYIDSTPETDDWKIGKIQRKTTADNSHFYINESNLQQVNLFKSSADSSCIVNNVYSSEVGNILNGCLPAKCKTMSKNGKDIKVANLYLGVPVATVKAGDTCDFVIDLLDNNDYELAFCIGGFDAVPITDISSSTSGCKVDNHDGNLITASGPSTNKHIKIEVLRDGVLFFKFGASNAAVKGTVKLPTSIDIEHT